MRGPRSGSNGAERKSGEQPRRVGAVRAKDDEGSDGQTWSRTAERLLVSHGPDKTTRHCFKGKRGRSMSCGLPPAAHWDT